MIQANELRIGNFILIDNGETPKYQYSIKGHDIEEIEGYRKDCFPIPLTTEILEKCGFEYVEEVMAWCDKSHAIYKFKNEEWGFNIFCAKDRDCTISVKYLHQLQNLYFSLTGTELNTQL